MYTDPRLKNLLPYLQLAMDKLGITDSDISNIEIVEKFLISRQKNPKYTEIGACYEFPESLDTLRKQGYKIHTGYSDNDEKNIEPSVIYLSHYNPETRVIQTDDQLLVALIHEVRHVYQHKYDKDLFRSGKPAEEDADAFAIAYMEACTSYNPDSYLWLIRRFMARDDGTRRRLADQMLTKYFKEEV